MLKVRSTVIVPIFSVTYYHVYKCIYFIALLECQQCTTRDPAYTLRVKCFHTFKLAFESKRTKLITLAINGIYVSLECIPVLTILIPQFDLIPVSTSILACYFWQKMIRDDRFQSNFEPEDDSLWFPSQLLHTFSSIQTQADDTQVDMLKVRELILLYSF